VTHVVLVAQSFTSMISLRARCRAQLERSAVAAEQSKLQVRDGHVNVCPMRSHGELTITGIQVLDQLKE